MLTNCTITDKDGKVTDYIWDDQKKAYGRRSNRKRNTLVAVA